MRASRVVIGYTADVWYLTFFSIARGNKKRCTTYNAAIFAEIRQMGSANTVAESRNDANVTKVLRFFIKIFPFSSEVYGIDFSVLQTLPATSLWKPPGLFLFTRTDYCPNFSRQLLINCLTSPSGNLSF